MRENGSKLGNDEVNHSYRTNHSRELRSRTLGHESRVEGVFDQSAVDLKLGIDRVEPYSASPGV
jgi:hypothetical protein